MQPLVRKPRILNLSTHNEPCGIAKYQESFVQSLNNQELALASFFHISPNIFKSQPEGEKQKSLNSLEHALKEYDILHIQHEFSFFSGNDLARFVDLTHNMGKKVVLTIHTPPSLVWTKPSSPRITGLSTFRIKLAVNKEIESFKNGFVNPLLSVDCIICPNRVIAHELMSLGIKSEDIRCLPHPIPAAQKGAGKNKLIESQLRHSEDDVLLAIIGFVANTKGIHHAIDALSFLPGNFKLAVIGGLHPSQGYTSDYLQQLLDQVIERGLQSRFYLTGYIEDDSVLFSAISECDICLFPYDLGFYRAVTSASVSMATASHKPAIVFPTPAFEELSLRNKSVQVCKLANGYEMAREVLKMSVKDKCNAAITYSVENSCNAIALKLAKLYEELAF